MEEYDAIKEGCVGELRTKLSTPTSKGRKNEKAHNGAILDKQR